MTIDEAIAVFDKSADPNAQTEAWAVIRAELMRASVAQAALLRAREDINWMLNSRQFLNGSEFGYLDTAIATTEQAHEAR